MIAHDHFHKWYLATKEWKDDGKLDLMTSMVEEIERLDYSATLDIPMNLLAPELIRIRPNAKVLYNYRAKGSANWYESMSFIKSFANGLFYARPWRWILPNPSKDMQPIIELSCGISEPDLSYPKHLARPLPWYEYLKNNQHYEDIKPKWIKIYDEFPALLQETLMEVNGEVSSTQYLEYTVQHGWEPLLDFILEKEGGHDELIKSLSKDGFPHVNDRATLMMIQKVLDFIGRIFPLFVLLLIYASYAMIRGIYRLLKKIAGMGVSAPPSSKTTNVE